MANLVSNSLKSSVRDAMKDVFDTFKRTEAITFYKTSVKEVTMVDPNFNSDFDDFDGYQTTFEETVESQSFYARIWYSGHQPIRRSLEGDEDLAGKFFHSWGRIRIQVDADGYAFLKDSTRMVLMGVPYKFDEDVRKLGLLGDFQFYEFLLERVN